MSNKTALVTTGATVTFKLLIERSLSVVVLEKLIGWKFEKLVVQFGPNSEELFKQLITKVGCTDVEEESEDGKISIKCCYKSLEIEGINFDRDLSKKYTLNSDLVISHGGSGSILDALRLEKKLVVLNNDQLSEGHQLDIIEQFLSHNQLVYCNDNYNEKTLCDCIDQLLRHSFEPIGQANGRVVQRIIQQVLSL